MSITMPAARPVLHRALAPLNALDLRDGEGTGDGSITFTGYAAVTDTLTTLYEGRSWVWRERIAPGAFARVLDELRSGAATYPVVLNHEHDNRGTLASTDVPASMMYGLELSEDTRGLRVFARLDPDDPDVQRVVPKVRGRAVTQMSFAFIPDSFTTVIEEDDDGRTIETDTVNEVRALFDVTICAHGAYPTTSADIRGLLAASGRSGFDPEGHLEGRSRDAHPASGGAPSTHVAPEAGSGDTDRAERLARLRSRVRVTVATMEHRSTS